MVARHSAARIAQLVALSAAALTAACSHNPPENMPADAQAAVVFANESLTQSDLFAVISGSSESRRLGTVFAGRTDTLRVPYEFTRRGGVSLVARMLTGGAVSSGVLSIQPGDTVTVRLPMTRNMLVVLP